MGFPKSRAGCPDPEPETGWLWVDRGGRVRIEPFRTLGDDAEGEAYAQRRGLEFPFSNDYHDAAAGPRHALELRPATICTGVILVGYQEPLNDHAVDCAELAAARRRLLAGLKRPRAAVRAPVSHRTLEILRRLVPENLQCRAQVRAQSEGARVQGLGFKGCAAH